MDADGTFGFERGDVDSAGLQRVVDRLLQGPRCPAEAADLLDLDLGWVQVAVRDGEPPGRVLVRFSAPALGSALTPDTARLLLDEIVLPALVEQLGPNCLGRPLASGARLTPVG